jgi:osmoprotectant transport system ATP-binding protein
MLRFEEVSKSYGDRVAVQPLDLAIEAGEVVVLLGPSGCGKTTILRMVAGLTAPSRGRIIVDGLELGPRTVGQVRRRLGYVIQEGGLFPPMTAGENVSIMARHEGWSRAAIQQRLDELVGMTQFPADGLRRYPNELSGGQRQRVSLMRALFLAPPLLLMDEPLGALDPLIRDSLQRDLKAVFARTGATVLLVTHDLVEASRLADRVCMVKSGCVVQAGAMREIVESPANQFVRDFVQSQVFAP